MPALPGSLPAEATSTQEKEPAELAKFRQEWLAELHKRKAGLQDSAGPSSSTVVTSDETSVAPQTSQHGKTFTALSANETAPARNLPTDHPALKDGKILPQPHMSLTLQHALNVYKRAVEHEQKGQLDDALISYRQAFRMHDNVDRVYSREQMLKSILKEQEEVESKSMTLGDVEDLSASFQSTVTIKSAHASIPIVLTGTLASLVRVFPPKLKFQPENENEPLLLNTLPDELLVMVISKLDPTSIERFGTVSRKARVLTLDSGVWRQLVRATYVPPQIPDYKAIVPVIEQFSSDFRRVYIEQPRLRLDGVYIAICHYVRPGLSENYWVNVSHLITYHRYLRFFPNGQVLSLLANEEKNPQEVIPILKPTLRMKGLFLGHWKLVGTTVHLSNLIDASGRFALPVPTSSGVISGASVVEEYISPGSSNLGQGLGSNHVHSDGDANLSSSGVPDRARYVFDMTLNLLSRPLGRWNKMDILSYDSVNLENGDIYPVALKHERPFWFSKVRSYA